MILLQTVKLILQIVQKDISFLQERDCKTDVNVSKI